MLLLFLVGLFLIYLRIKNSNIVLIAPRIATVVKDASNTNHLMEVPNLPPNIEKDTSPLTLQPLAVAGTGIMKRYKNC